MRVARSLSVSSVLALLTVLVLATNVAAASMKVTTLRDTCTLSGGMWGDGQIALKVRATERGLTGVTSIRFTASLMHRQRPDGTTWATHLTQERTTRYSADTTSTNRWAWKAGWDLGGDTIDYHHRIEMAVTFLGPNGGVVAVRNVVGTDC